MCVWVDHIPREQPDTRDQIANKRLARASSASESDHPRRISSVRHAVVKVAGHSIPMVECLCSGLVQRIFCPPSRRTIVCLLLSDRAPRRRAKNALPYAACGIGAVRSLYTRSNPARTSALFNYCSAIAASRPPRAICGLPQPKCVRPRVRLTGSHAPPGVLCGAPHLGQTIIAHPHLHCVIPGDGLSPDGTQWVACRPGFFLPVRVLSRLFRRLFLQRLQAAYDAETLRLEGSIQPPGPRSGTCGDLS